MIRGSLARFRGHRFRSRVNVLVDSQMTIHPDSVDWVAVLRYDVVGGALDVDSPEDAGIVVGGRRPSFRREQTSTDDRDARPDRDLDDHAGAARAGARSDL